MADLRDGRQGRGLPAAELEARDPAQADAAALPQPRQSRHPRSHSLAATSDQAEETGVYVLGETAATKLLVDDGRVVEAGDKGRGRDGEELSNFEPGADLIAKATVLAEGTQGHLTGAAIRHFDLGSEDPQQWELGVKECGGREAARQGHPHMAWPLRFGAKYQEFGGSFIYPMGEGASRWASSAGWTTATPPSASTTLCSS